MKKHTNNFRKCPNCPHRESISKCCCLRQSNQTLRSRNQTTRAKKIDFTREQDSVRDTLRIPVIIAQNNTLRSENNLLRKELLNVSSFLKDDTTCVTTLNTNQTILNQPYYLQQDPASLSERLFQSNKTLKQATLHIDSLSRLNKEIHERNIELSTQIEALRQINEETQVSMEQHKKRANRYKAMLEEQNRKQQQQCSLVDNHTALQESRDQMTFEIKRLRQQLQNYRAGTTSPGWVAHTSIKHHELQPPVVYEHSFLSQHLQTLDCSDEIKQSICKVIQTICQQSQKLYNNQEVSSSQPLFELLSTMLQMFAQSIFSSSGAVQREIQKKLAAYQRKVSHLLARLENMTIKLKNRQLRSLGSCRREEKWERGQERRNLLEISNRNY